MSQEIRRANGTFRVQTGSIITSHGDKLESYEVSPAIAAPITGALSTETSS